MAEAPTVPPFPYKTTYIETTPQQFLAHLADDAVFNTLVEEKRDDAHPFPTEIVIGPTAYRMVHIVTDLFTEDARIRAHLHGQLSPLAYWNLNHASLAKKAKEMFPEYPLDNYGLRFALSQSAKEATNFSPVLSRKIYDTFLPPEGGRVLDPFSGWGDRSIGALASPRVLSYDGVDCNTALVPGYTRLTQTLDQNHKIQFHITPWQCFVAPRREYDLIFTSPPYFDFEIYSSESTQSCAGQATYDAWWQNFMQPAVRKMRALIKPEGHIALHIGHTYRTPNFVDDVKTLMVEQLGLRFVQTIECLTVSKTRSKPTRPICIYVYQAPSIGSPGSPSSNGGVTATVATDSPAPKRCRVN